MDDFFDTDMSLDSEFDNLQPTNMTKDEFIQKTRSMLKHILDEYSNHWKDKFDFDTENFVAFIEHGVIFGDEPFFDLLHCNIID